MARRAVSKAVWDCPLQRWFYYGSQVLLPLSAVSSYSAEVESVSAFRIIPNATFIHSENFYIFDVQTGNVGDISDEDKLYKHQNSVLRLFVGQKMYWADVQVQNCFVDRNNGNTLSMWCFRGVY